MQSNFRSWFRGLGVASGHLADFLQIVTTFGVALTVVTVAVVAIWSDALQWIQRPSVYIPALTFLFLLWAIVGIVLLISFRSIQVVRVAHDYAYSLIVDGGWVANVGAYPLGHRFANQRGINVALQVRNVGHGPMKLLVEEIRVVLEGRTADDPGVGSSTILMFARMGIKQIRSGAIRLDQNAQVLEGTATYKFLYGPPDGEFVRRYSYAV